MSQGMNSVRKGIKFERRIWHELEYYGGIVTRCADSKPVDLIWILNGIAYLIECKDQDGLNWATALDVLRVHCNKGGVRGILIWQDAQFNVNIFLISGAKLGTVTRFVTTKDLSQYMHHLEKQ